MIIILIFIATFLAGYAGGMATVNIIFTKARIKELKKQKKELEKWKI